MTARGEIINYNPPAKAKEGDEVKIPTTIKNVGDTVGEFKMYLFDDDTNEQIEDEPSIYWKNLNPGEIYLNTLDTKYWYGAMPNHDWNLRIECREQTLGIQDTKQFTVVLQKTIPQCLFPRLTGDLTPRISQASPLPRFTCIIENYIIKK